MLSIIITYHNEGQPFLEECIAQLRNTIHISPYEIIVVDDHSKHSLNIPDVKVIRHEYNKGVGQSFDTGVENAIYENIFLMACDMRFIDNGWADILLQEIIDYPKAITCTACIGLNRGNMDISIRRNISRVAGATILIFHDQKSNPKKKANFRGLVEAKWLPYKQGDSYEVPCILGACYGVNKEWYQYIDGFWGHMLWSNLEPYISMKSYLFGGSCRVATAAETGHIFKLDGIHGTSQEAMLYNKMLISMLLFDDHSRLISFLGNDRHVKRAKEMVQANILPIAKKKLEYQSKICFTMDQFVEKFNLDYRK
jgi:hypothetical protein